MDGNVTITKKEYLSLLKSAEELQRLESGGVDNWEYYSDSIYGDIDEEDWDDFEERVEKEVAAL